MTWKTHILGGVAAGACTVLLYQNLSGNSVAPDILVPVLTISGMAALIPDVDEIKSKAGKILLPVSLIFYVLQTIIKVTCVFTFGKIKRRIRENTRFLMHRGICHYPITITIISLVAYLIVFFMAVNKKAGIIGVTALLIGLISHIALDIISGKIALLFPISKKRIGISLVESGGILEAAIVRPLLLILCTTVILKTMR